jgi:hypothetical protein
VQESYVSPARPHEIVTADAKGWLIGRPAASIDAFSLSNICELMSLEETALTFEELLEQLEMEPGFASGT